METDSEYVLKFGDIAVNLDRETVTRGGRDVRLTRAEFQLLSCFLVNAGRDLTRDMLIDSVWFGVSSPNTRTVDAHVLRLRKKLESDPGQPRHFVTLHKVGYRFCGLVQQAC